MTLGQLADAIGNIEEMLNEIRTSEVSSQLDDLNDNLTFSLESLGSGPLYDNLTKIQEVVEVVVSGINALNNINLEELAE